jgi:hypothetical protein
MSCVVRVIGCAACSSWRGVDKNRQCDIGINLSQNGRKCVNDGNAALTRGIAKETSRSNCSDTSSLPRRATAYPQSCDPRTGDVSTLHREVSKYPSQIRCMFVEGIRLARGGNKARSSPPVLVRTSQLRQQRPTPAPACDVHALAAIGGRQVIDQITRKPMVRTTPSANQFVGGSQAIGYFKTRTMSLTWPRSTDRS